MTGIRIENSERGITLNKSLAWTMLAALVGLVWYGGTTVARLSHTLDTQTAALSELRAALATDRGTTMALESRIRALEQGSVRLDVRLDAMVAVIEEIRASQRETNDLLRRIGG